jgi:phage terminase Nu1 subunit (DNA packaging protein)
VYEKLDVSILRDVVEWAYERSSARYKAVRDSLGEPDPFRLKYRPQLSEAVRAIVASRVTFEAASSAAYIPEADQTKFRELLLSELDSLHEGNFGRYGLRPGEFLEWDQQGRPR